MYRLATTEYYVAPDVNRTWATVALITIAARVQTASIRQRIGLLPARARGNPNGEPGITVHYMCRRMTLARICSRSSSGYTQDVGLISLSNAVLGSLH